MEPFSTETIAREGYQFTLQNPLSATVLHKPKIQSDLKSDLYLNKNRFNRLPVWI
jgi:hypothetical protein